MQRGRTAESNQQSVPDRGADSSAPRSTPLTLVSGAVAGGDLGSVAGAAAEALGCSVVIAIPALGEPVVRPPDSLASEQCNAILAHAVATISGDPDSVPPAIAEAVPVRIGEQVVGIVAAAASSATADSAPDRRPWLDAAAAAASVTAVIRNAQNEAPDDSERAVLQELAAGPPGDVAALLDRARRLGSELEAGAVALCAQAGNPGLEPELDVAPRELGMLLAEIGRGRLLGIAPLGSPGLDEITRSLRERGWSVAVSAPRRDPACLHEALHEAELLVELGLAPDVQLAEQDETYRLLIGVLLRDREELSLLQERTISPLVQYDDRHDTDLLWTLRAFLAHDGSTTETADAMHLHRHTVGYRLSRVHEVSGLSPYESDGRERLSLGLKAHQILDAEQRRHDAPT